ncbi:MAG UNVERIFIED_CONTAM: hypothetical protein LVR29_13445 [Microcystis novacekii LVE1205-3]|jgi:hypothetical protein
MIPWDFRDGIRSWLFPGILAGIMKLTAGFSEGSSGYSASVKIFLSLLSLIPVWIGILDRLRKHRFGWRHPNGRYLCDLV